MIWCNLGHPKVCYYQPKTHQFYGGKNQQENLIAIILSQINLDEHVSTKINTFRINKGEICCASPPEAEENFKKSNKMEAFPYFSFAFWQGSLYPQNYELAP